MLLLASSISRVADCFGVLLHAYQDLMQDKQELKKSPCISHILELAGLLLRMSAVNILTPNLDQKAMPCNCTMWGN